MGCNSSTAAAAPAAAGNGPAARARDGLRQTGARWHNKSDSAAAGLAWSAPLEPGTFAAWSSCDVGASPHVVDARLQVCVDMAVDSPSVSSTAPVIPSSVSSGTRKQFKWIAATMWEQGDVCDSCGSATPKGCAPGCQPSPVQRGWGRGLSIDSHTTAGTWSSPRRHPRGASKTTPTQAPKKHATLDAAMDAGGAIAQYRLGQAMAAMRLRRSPGPGSPSRPRAGSPQLSVIPARRYRSHEAACPSSLRACATMSRGESTASADQDAHTPDPSTPGSYNSDDGSLANTLSFHTFNTLLGYSQTDSSPSARQVSRSENGSEYDLRRDIFTQCPLSPLAAMLDSQGSDETDDSTSDDQSDDDGRPAQVEKRSPRPTCSHPQATEGLMRVGHVLRCSSSYSDRSAQ